jgi:hypothetical protein
MLDRSTEASNPKKAYVEPALTEYGSVARLSQGSGSQANEGNMKKSCL